VTGVGRYGLPYLGSKSRIAEWVVSVLPPAPVLVDLFAGGCAVTHAALLSGKWKRIICNDVTDTTQMFVDAIRGEYGGYATVPDRGEFFERKDEDPALALLYSFGNDRLGYLWSKELEPVKVHASRMLSAPSMHERRMEYMKFLRALRAYVERNGTKNLAPEDTDTGGHGLERLQQLHGLEGLERLQGLERLERLQGLQGLEASSRDYRDVLVPYGATVYADPPYRGTDGGAYTWDAAQVAEFDAWLASVPFPVYVSEFTCPAGCVEVASHERTQRCAATPTQVTERIFVQERFADSVPPMTLFDTNGGDPQ